MFGNGFERLLDVTKRLSSLVESRPVDAGNERDEYIEKLTALTEERGEILAGISVEPSESDKVYLKQTVALNERISPLLEVELNRVKRDISVLKKKKDTGLKYENPYSHAPLDGAFIDKKN